MSRADRSTIGHESGDERARPPLSVAVVVDPEEHHAHVQQPQQLGQLLAQGGRDLEVRALDGATHQRRAGLARRCRLLGEGRERRTRVGGVAEELAAEVVERLSHVDEGLHHPAQPVGEAGMCERVLGGGRVLDLELVVERLDQLLLAGEVVVGAAERHPRLVRDRAHRGRVVAAGPEERESSVHDAGPRLRCLAGVAAGSLRGHGRHPRRRRREAWAWSLPRLRAARRAPMLPGTTPARASRHRGGGRPGGPGILP